MRKSFVSSEESSSEGQSSISNSTSSRNEPAREDSEKESLKNSSDSKSASGVEDEPITKATKSSGTIKKQIKQSKKSKRNKTTKEQQILGVHILQTSTLKFKKRIRAPRVRVSLYDQKTEKLLNKSKPDKNVIFNQEPGSLDFILPIISDEGQITDEFSFLWNEVIIINDDLEHLKNGLLFFEVIDVAQDANKKGHKKVCGGWYHICWAFMLLTSQRQQCFGIKITLQLFQYIKASKNYPIYKQWSMPALKKYPATIEVKLICLSPKIEDVGLTRPFTALQVDRKVPWSSDNNFAHPMEINDTLSLPNWQKARELVRGKSFEPPEEISFETQTNGSNTVCCFSADGKYIAYADNITRSPKVVVRNCLNLLVCLILGGHTDLIHSLYWWNDEEKSSRILISTSQDKSCIIWEIEEFSFKIKNVLPHPCFLYFAVFAPSYSKRDAQIVTGGRDGILYVWSILSKSPRIFQELQNHKSYIVGIGYSTALGNLFSAEVNGEVIEWRFDDGSQRWMLHRKFDLKNTIKQFTLHPMISNIYILLERTLVKMDIKSGTQLKILSNHVVSLHAVKFTISQNGAYVFLASDVYIMGFHQFSEKAICSIRVKRNYGRINCIHFQSHQNLLAISTQSKLFGGAFLVYAPKKAEQANAVVIKQKDSVDRPNLENSSFSDILMKLERILKISNFTATERSKPSEETEDVLKDNLTYSVNANQTFIVRQVADHRQQLDENDSIGHTFTVNLASTSSDTDVSENLPSSVNEDSVSSHNTNRTITICKEVN